MISRAWLDAAPAGTLVPVEHVRGLLDAAPAAPSEETPSAPASWRERIWSCPPETRLGVAELAEAIGRPKSFVYARTGAAAGGAGIPCRKLDGALVFVASEVRTWLATKEERIIAPSATVFPLEPSRRRRRGSG